jgi:hypothetical protein
MPMSCYRLFGFQKDKDGLEVGVFERERESISEEKNECGEDEEQGKKKRMCLVWNGESRVEVNRVRCGSCIISGSVKKAVCLGSRTWELVIPCTRYGAQQRDMSEGSWPILHLQLGLAQFWISWILGFLERL